MIRVCTVRRISFPALFFAAQNPPSFHDRKVAQAAFLLYKCFFSDKIGAKLTITLGLFIGSLTYLIFAFLSYINADFTTFVLFLFLMPLGGGIALPVMLSTFLHSSPPWKNCHRISCHKRDETVRRGDTKKPA